MRRMHESRARKAEQMKTLILTVAGTSSRFSKSIGRDMLKCIYYENDLRSTLLCRMVEMAASEFDDIVIVGGFKFDDLSAYVESAINVSVRKKIRLVCNQHYVDRGSGWSLFLAIEAIKSLSGPLPDTVIFAEGDLYVDGATFQKVVQAEQDVITCNSDVIDAAKSVAFYCDRDYHPHYLYDVSHGLIEIDEPFTRIYNSGQVWGFADVSRLVSLSNELDESLHAKTNLELINSYYSDLSLRDLEVIRFNTWVNCNTLNDYRRAFQGED